MLALVTAARYLFQLRGAWCWIYSIGSVLALYLNMFVLVVQLFRRVPVLNALATTQSGPPFFLVQAIVVAVFIFVAIATTKRFHTNTISPI